MGIETLAAAALASTVIGGVVSGGGAIAGGIAQKKAADYQAAVAGINADLARQQGVTAQFNQQLKTAGILGQQKAAQGASGVDVNFGSTVDVRESTAELGRLDALTIMHNAELKAFGYETQAQVAKATGDNAMLAGLLGGVGSVLGSTASVGGKWASFRSAGIPGYI